MTKLKDTILTQIAAGEVAMRPRWHFVLKAALALIGSVIGVLVAVYLLSFVLFILRETGLLFVPLFGLQGLLFFVVRSPWLLIGLVGIFLIILAVLVRHYAFSYRQPVLFTFLGLVLFVILTSTAIHYTMVHNKVQRFVNDHPIPGLTPLYRNGIGPRPDGVTPGVISNLTATSFHLVTPHQETFTITITPQTKLPRHPLSNGDTVMVFGDEEDTTHQITARGIRPFTPGQFPPPPRSREEH